MRSAGPVCNLDQDLKDGPIETEHGRPNRSRTQSIETEGKRGELSEAL